MFILAMAKQEIEIRQRINSLIFQNKSLHKSIKDAKNRMDNLFLSYFSYLCYELKVSAL